VICVRRGTGLAGNIVLWGRSRGPHCLTMFTSAPLPKLALFALLASLFAPATAASSYNYCRSPSGQLSIQDSPCKGDSKLLRVYREEAPKPKRSRAARVPPPSMDDGAAAAKPAVASSSNGGVPVGLRNQRNKTVICGLLAVEKQEAEAQIAGRATAPAGESPHENLTKIERQRSRVACDS